MLTLCAGYDASMFTLSLPRNYRNQQIADFARVEGLPGVYMANQLEASIFDDPSSVPYDKNYNDYLQSKVCSLLHLSSRMHCLKHEPCLKKLHLFQLEEAASVPALGRQLE